MEESLYNDLIKRIRDKGYKLEKLTIIEQANK